MANTKPSYCSAYFNHEWTVTGDSVKYIGDEKNGGKWVDVR
ncbi:TrbM/KikA/MpfK family conjugal transfer protein [Snodgrassella sp. CFCC 13594]